MFGWFSKKASKEDFDQYVSMISKIALENRWQDESFLTELGNFVSEKHFTNEQLAEAQPIACSQIWDSIMQDGLVTQDEAEKFSKYLDSCIHLTPKQTRYWKNKIKLNRRLYEISVNDTLPVHNTSEVNIIYKPGEILHYYQYGDIMKKKTVTKRVNYSGPSASIRICKGVRYRVGSVSVSRETANVWKSEAHGLFWITNMRIGFLGNTQAFAFPISKLFSVSVGGVGIHIYKEGRSTPFIVGLPEYEEPCAIISNLLNKQ